MSLDIDGIAKKLILIEGTLKDHAQQIIKVLENLDPALVERIEAAAKNIGPVLQKVEDVCADVQKLVTGLQEVNERVAALELAQNEQTSAPASPPPAPEQGEGAAAPAEAAANDSAAAPPPTPETSTT